MHLLDIRFSFLCLGTHLNEQGKNPVILRIHFNNNRRDLFTGLYCYKIDWDAANNKVLKTDKSFHAINQNLDVILRNATNDFDAMRFSRENFSIDELIDKIKGKDKRPELLIEFLVEEIEKVKKRIGIDLAKSSYYRYRRTLKYLQDFLMAEFKMRNYTLNRIDEKFLGSYFQYLRSVKNLSHNTAIKFVQMVKSNLLPAIKLGVIKGDPFQELKLRFKPIYPNFLSPEELSKVANTELNNPILEVKRDIFLFACYTGLAYVDLAKLTGNDIFQDIDGSWHIRKTRQKTGEQFIIPLLHAAEKIFFNRRPS